MARAWNDNGRWMAGFVEGVGLNDECRAFFLSWFLAVRLRFEIDSPDLTSPDGLHQSSPSEVLPSMKRAAEAL